MKTDGEIFEIVLERKKEYDLHKKEVSRRVAGLSAGIIAFAVCITAGVMANRNTVTESEGGLGNRSSPESGGVSGFTEEQTAVTYPAEAHTVHDILSADEYTGKEMQTTGKIYSGANIGPGSDEMPEPTQVPSTESEKDASGGIYGGDSPSGGVMIPAVPSVVGAKSGVAETGEKITDAEAKEYLEKNKTSIASSLSASGVPAENLTFSEKGYSHVSYDGTEGKQLEVRENFRDYLAYNNGKLVAIITVTKDNGRLSSTPAFGGPWFDDYNNFLQTHKGEKLLYVYAGFMEIIITPDNKCYNPQGSDVSDYLQGVDNPYEYFYTESATYVP
ncbi:MAG: hypothetical protein IJJ61_03700 [Clostridia bacterium]|nr:hypothetical protein [Clostridia bacterium]